MVQSYLADATTALPPPAAVPPKPYRPKLTLAYLGAPTVGVGVSNQAYGNGISGAVSAGFSDMLETRQVGAALAAQGTFKDIGGEVYYKNTTRRWNWLTGLSHIPYVQTYQTYNEDVVNNTPVVRVDQILQRVYAENASFTTQFPFSQTRRIEFTASYNRYAYGSEGVLLLLPAQRPVPGTGAAGRRSTHPPSLSFGQASIAFVGDYSYFGFASPVAGGRYRFEVSPSLGQINFTTLLGDYRRYFFYQPVTFAMRGLLLRSFRPGRRRPATAVSRCTSGRKP